VVSGSMMVDARGSVTMEEGSQGLLVAIVMTIVTIDQYIGFMKLGRSHAP